MIKVMISYGKEQIPVLIPKENFLDIVKLPQIPELKDEEGAIINALENPIGTLPLRQLASPGQKVTIIVDDITRPTPTKKMMGPIVKILEDMGILDQDVTVIFSTGSHRFHTIEEKTMLLGEEYLSRFRVIDHDANDIKNMINLGRTSRGTPVEVSKYLIEADLKILTGLIKPHSYAGYSGGGKSILPGVCSMNTIIADHDYASTLHEFALLGQIEGNPMRKDIEEAASMIPNCFIVNTIITPDKKIAAVVAGDMIQAHRHGAHILDNWVKIPTKGPGDIIVAGCSHPTSISLYQAANAISTCLRIPTPIVRDGGTVIVTAPCPDGIGSDGPFYQLVSEAKSPEEVLNKLQQPGFFVHDQWAAQSYCGDLAKVDLIMISETLDERILNEMLAGYAFSVQDGLENSLKKHGPSSKVIVVQDASCVIPALI
ncbi:MAG: nickel-dependent lactate racemase [Dehalobacterium sp.]